MPSIAEATAHTVAVESRDPSLSAEANALLTRDLQAAVGATAVEVGPDWVDHRADRHATHRGVIAAAIEVRILVVSVGVALGMAAILAAAGTSSNWAPAAAAFAVLLGVMGVMVYLVLRMFDTSEHPAPETSALLSAEGVGDPDRTFSDLVRDFRPREAGGHWA